MLIDLRNLKKRLDVESEIDRTSSPDTLKMKAETDEVERGTQQKRWLAIALVARVLATAGIFAFSVWRSRVRNNVAPTVSPPTPVPAEERTLTYWITVQRFRDKKPYEKSFR